jgi:hypothetical protein
MVRREQMATTKREEKHTIMDNDDKGQGLGW